MPAIVEIVKGVRAMGMETCMTLGMLTPQQAGHARRGRARLLQPQHRHFARALWRGHHHAHDGRPAGDAGHVREAGINVCSGGIVGMGETRADRVGFIHTLATLPRHPESVPVNALVPVKGTVLGDMLADTPLARIDDIEFVRTVAVARITMPLSMVRLSAGRESHVRGDAGAVLSCRSQFDLHRRQPADRAQCRRRCRRRAVCAAGLKPMTGEEPLRANGRAIAAAE